MYQQEFLYKKRSRINLPSRHINHTGINVQFMRNTILPGILNSSCINAKLSNNTRWQKIPIKDRRGKRGLIDGWSLWRKRRIAEAKKRNGLIIRRVSQVYCIREKGWEEEKRNFASGISKNTRLWVLAHDHSQQQSCLKSSMKSFPPPIPAKAAALANLITESDEINLDSLVDCLVAVYTDCSLIRRDRKDSQNPINKFLEKCKNFNSWH